MSGSLVLSCCDSRFRLCVQTLQRLLLVELGLQDRADCVDQRDRVVDVLGLQRRRKQRVRGVEQPAEVGAAAVETALPSSLTVVRRSSRGPT